MAFRTANDDEAAALIFTFEEQVGKKFIDYIRIGTGEGESEKQEEVLLAENYTSAYLYDLGIFIQKATRVWQQLVGRYHQRKGGSDYRYTDLYRLREINDRENGSIDINGKQHARAVRDWFWVTYGSANHLVGSGARRLTVEWLWDQIIPVLGVDSQYIPKFGEKNLGGNGPALQQVASNHYGCVIKEIRDPKPFLQLTNLGSVKAGRVLPN